VIDKRYARNKARIRESQGFPNLRFEVFIANLLQSRYDRAAFVPRDTVDESGRRKRSPDFKFYSKIGSATPILGNAKRMEDHTPAITAMR